VIDRVEAAEASDLTGFAPRERELSPEAYQPRRAGELVPWFRNAGVARVLSLDPLSHAELVPMTAVPAGPSGVAIQVYGLNTWPRASLACRATPVARPEEALALPYRKGFDPWREVALVREGSEGPDDALPATCTKGRARLASRTAEKKRYEVEANASAYLVMRASYAGLAGLRRPSAQPVLRANGSTGGPVNAGRHEVVLRYEAPDFPGIVLDLLALVTAAVLFVASGRGRV
jgi:hypothetical protein